MTAQPKRFLDILCRYPVNVEFGINCFCCCVDWEFTEDAYIYGSTDTEGGFIGDDVENNEANASNVAGDENEQTLSEEASYLDVEEEATDTPNSLLGELWFLSIFRQQTFTISGVCTFLNTNFTQHISFYHHKRAIRSLFTTMFTLLTFQFIHILLCLSCHIFHRCYATCTLVNLSLTTSSWGCELGARRTYVPSLNFKYGRFAFWGKDHVPVGTFI